MLAEIEKLSETASAENRELTTEESARARKLLGEADEIEAGITRTAEQVRSINEIAEARRVQFGKTADVSVRSEPMVYGCDGDKFQSEHSYWHDRIILEKYGNDHPFANEARGRKLQWAHQVEREIALRSQFGQHAEAELREHYRELDPMQARVAIEEARARGRVGFSDKYDDGSGAEARATGTGGGATASASGGGAAAFVLPAFVGPYVVYREYGRAFADQCAKPPMPSYGLGIYKPAVTGGAGYGSYTELGTVIEQDPTAGFLAGALGIYSGQVVLSQAVLDRTAPDFRYDLMVSDQIARKEAPILDAYVIGKAITNGASAIAYTSTFAVASTSGVNNSLYGHVSQAKATMRKAAGAVLNPTHVWMDPVRWEVVAAWGDANGRPVTIPDYAGPFQALAAGSADGDAGVEGATGYRFNGLRAFTDPSIPTTGGTVALDQVLVTCQSEIEYYEGAPVDRILNQTLASNLEVIIQRYRYLTVIENYSAACQPIQGAAFSAPSWGS